MQLEELKSDTYVNIPGNIKAPWYTRHKRILWLIVVLSAVAVIIIIATISTRCIACKNGAETMQYTKDSVPLEWDGSCPRTVPSCPLRSQSNPPLLIISLDGFRSDYLSRGISPTLTRIAECGVQAEFMYPVYPTKTFPNHYTIVTGLYPAFHGIIDNTMYDDVLKKKFRIGMPSAEDPLWWQKEPIWVTATKQGKKSATYFWPGSDMKINGYYPDIYLPFNKSTPLEVRVDQVLEWLDSPTSPDFLTLYFGEPDRTGHEFGPDSLEVEVAIQRVDKMVDRLFAGLQTRGLIDCVNIIITSDHGMSSIDCDRVMDIRKYVNTSDMFPIVGAFGRLRPKNNSVSVDDIISSFECQNRHVRVYGKERLPVHFHYVENTRIEPVILDADAGWTFVNQDVKQGDSKCSGGAHGFDNLFPDMRAIFLAHGPAFVKNFTIHPFLNIEIYELMCELIGIDPNPNNGTRGSLHHVLKNPHPLSQQIFSSELVPEALVPSNLEEIDTRMNSSNCSCSEMPKMNNTEQKDSILYHLPFGTPHSAEDNNSLFLHNSDYILVYHSKRNCPLWAAFTLNELKKRSGRDICWSGDPRVENATCLDPQEGFLQRPLYSQVFSHNLTESQAFFVTNSILKSVNHTTLLEKEVNNMIEQKVLEVGPVNVMMGPAVDHLSISAEHDFVRSKPDNSSMISTYIFVILTWCSESVTHLVDCDPRNLDVTSFLLPNYPFPHNCEAAESIIKKNVVRIADIEKLTTISFYSRLPIYETLRLRTSLPRLTHQ